MLPGAASTVIGGSTLEPSISWWQQLIAAGGLADMDVAAIHPYTGNNDSFEEDGMPAQVRQLEALLGATPLWFTEVGWWGDGDYNFLGQANTLARTLIWQKALGVPVMNYFFDEGSWGNNGVSFSLIQTANTDDYVKPAALATMVASTELAGRPYVSMPATGIPQTYRPTSGRRRGGTTDLAAVWTDGLADHGERDRSPRPAATTDPGDGRPTSTGTPPPPRPPRARPTACPSPDQVTYLTYPAGDTLTVGPTESFGTNVAAASDGATATASSGTRSAAIDGLPVGDGQGWSSASGDTTPS